MDDWHAGTCTWCGCDALVINGGEDDGTGGLTRWKTCAACHTPDELSAPDMPPVPTQDRMFDFPQTMRGQLSL
jgi:hypothetical protein